MYILKFIKKYTFTIIFILFLLLLILYSNSNLQAAKQGMLLWCSSVVPSLFPFFVATELLNHTNTAYLFGRAFHKVMRPLFNVPGEGSYALIMGFISGYPVGAKIVSDFYDNKVCTKDEAERMLAFTNNSGPLFIIGTVGIALFGSSDIGALLLVTHIFSSLTVGIIYGIYSRYKSRLTRSIEFQNTSPANTYVDISKLGDILSFSIRKSISTVLQIGGFVVLFSVILSILSTSGFINGVSIVAENLGIPSNISNGLIRGFIELTNGLKYTSNIHLKNISFNIILCAFLLGFGGISIMLQVLSVITKYKLSIKKYFYGKILQGLIAAAYTAIIINFIPIFNLNI